MLGLQGRRWEGPSVTGSLRDLILDPRPKRADRLLLIIELLVYREGADS